MIIRLLIFFFFGLFLVGCAQRLSEGSAVHTNTTINPHLQYNDIPSSDGVLR